MAPFSSLRFLLAGSLLAAALPQAHGQVGASVPSFYTTYGYTAYTVFEEASSDAPPTQVSGVGGTLTLRADGSYEKHMSIVAPGGPHYFNQKGTFALVGDSIRFTFSDQKGTDTQRGTFQFDPASQHLTITILGYPTGNKGVYELMVAPPPPAPVPTAPPPHRSKKRRR